MILSSRGGSGWGGGSLGEGHQKLKKKDKRLCSLRSNSFSICHCDIRSSTMCLISFDREKNRLFCDVLFVSSP